MIRTTLHGPAKRRIAVIEIPRPQRARLGSIGCPPPPAIAWTTISDEPGDSSANWISSVLAAQDYARSTTPGTLTFTPASNTPQPNTAPWNSWTQPNCGGAAGAPVPSAADAMTDPAAATPPPAAPSHSTLWLIAGLLGAAASAKYIFSSTRR